jgi:hypothetical protein
LCKRRRRYQNKRDSQLLHLISRWVRQGRLPLFARRDHFSCANRVLRDRRLKGEEKGPLARLLSHQP